MCIRDRSEPVYSGPISTANDTLFVLPNSFSMLFRVFIASASCGSIDLVSDFLVLIVPAIWTAKTDTRSIMTSTRTGNFVIKFEYILIILLLIVTCLSGYAFLF